MNFNDAFIARTRDNSGIARKYIQGLLLNQDRGNCSRFAKKIRKSSNQSLQHFITHYLVENKLPGKELWLIIRKEVGQDTIKYQLTNAAPDTDISRLAKMSCSRYWIERAIQDAKGVGSLEDYEARFWRSWHHHIAMSLLAMLAVLMMQLEFIKAKHKARLSASESHHRRQAAISAG